MEILLLAGPRLTSLLMSMLIVALHALKVAAPIPAKIRSITLIFGITPKYGYGIAAKTQFRREGTTTKHRWRDTLPTPILIHWWGEQILHPRPQKISGYDEAAAPTYGSPSE